MKKLTCPAMIALVLPLLHAQTPPRPAAPASGAALLDQRVPEASFDQVPLEQIMNWLGDFTQANVVVRWQALEDLGISRDKPISLKLRNVRLSQLFWMLLNEAGGSDVKLAYTVSGNIITISTEADLNGEMVLKVYDVADLALRVPRFRSAALEPQLPGDNGGNGGSLLQQVDQEPIEDDDPTAPGIELLVDIIRDTVEPDSWADNGGQGSIRAYGTLLVVRNNPKVHAELGGFLNTAN